MGQNKRSVIIRQCGKSAMQSGEALLNDWWLEYDTEDFAPSETGRIDPLTGRYGGRPTLSQLRMRFPDKEAAIAYAEAKSLDYKIADALPAKIVRPKSYSDNFARSRRAPWTH